MNEGGQMHFNTNDDLYFADWRIPRLIGGTKTGLGTALQGNLMAWKTKQMETISHCMKKVERGFRIIRFVNFTLI